MPKLHEVLAAESVASKQADKCRTDLLNTFDKKRHLFEEKNVTFHPADEGAQPVVEEQSKLQSTIPDELTWIRGIWSPALDSAYQIDLGNLVAKADIVLDDGTIIAKDVPATTLLQMEKRVDELHALVDKVPTLDPAKGYEPDAQKGKHVYKSREESKTRTKKTQRAIVLIAPTPEHPGQAQLITDDLPTGTIRSVSWSSLITPAQKAELLERAERLKRAIKTARARANDTPCPEHKIGDTLLGYVLDAVVATKRV